MNKLFHGKLNWYSNPSKILPHGINGLITFFSGSFFILQALYFGHDQMHPWGYTIYGPQPKWLFYLFLYAAFANGLSGLRMYKKAPKLFQVPFVLGATCQISYVWFAFRFFSLGSATLSSSIDQETSSNGSTNWFWDSFSASNLQIWFSDLVLGSGFGIT